MVKNPRVGVASVLGQDVLQVCMIKSTPSASSAAAAAIHRPSIPSGDQNENGMTTTFLMIHILMFLAPQSLC